MSAPIVRFAPSPTGLLHLGNARVALANWLFARAQRGRFLLRLDDTDAERSKPEFAAAISQDLGWLGITWDDAVRQSDRLDRYEAAAEHLKASGRLYPCFETEIELDIRRKAAIKRGRPPVYDRAALLLAPEEIARRIAAHNRPHWRFRLSDGQASWRDLVLGPRQVGLGTLSDPVCIRFDGTPLYTFTSVVDDAEMGVTHVIRGEDHVTNTAVQLDLLAALGVTPDRVRFGHLPLLLGEDGGPLSKRIGSLGLRRLRDDGIDPLPIASILARLGTSRDVALASSLDELVAEFDLGSFSRSSARLDTRALLRLNRQRLQILPFEAVRERLAAMGVGGGEAFWLAVRGNLDLLPEAREWWRVVGGEIVTEANPGEAPFLRQAETLLPPEPWDGTTWGAWTGALAGVSGRKGKTLYQPLRMALTGEAHGPDLGPLLPLMGRARAASRLAMAAQD